MVLRAVESCEDGAELRFKIFAANFVEMHFSGLLFSDSSITENYSYDGRIGFQQIHRSHRIKYKILDLKCNR